MKRLDPFTRAYIEAMLWSTNDNADESGGEPLDANYDETDIAPHTLAQIVEDCTAFQRDNEEHIAAGCYRNGPDYTADQRAGFRSWLAAVLADYTSFYGDEAFSAHCEANDYEFTKNGEFYR